ncbi:MAG: DUF1573 domain-containing protein [Planctomycetaceae bacterium]|nr:DUF1573 domain-containing protein [Planctomycetaceae bacterium]
MIRLLFIFVTFIGLIFIFGFGNVYSDSWGESLFAIRRYDFGRVAIGAKAEYRFAMTNRFKQDIRIISLNTSCGCTLSSLSSKLIVSGGTEYLIATLNTGGQHTHENKAIITIHFEVTVDGRVLYDSAQIAVSGYIRPDVVLLPSGVIEFGAVKRGETVVRRIRLEYAGKEGWELTKVERSNPHIHVRAEAIPFADGSFWQNGEINYQIIATLKPDTPAGYVKDVIKFSTNEKNKDNLLNNEINRNNEIMIPISGVVNEPLQVKPSPFVIGAANNDAAVAKNIVVRSDRQFRILGVSCEDKRLRFTFSEHESSIQIIAASFRTKNNTNSKSNQNTNIKIQIHTNLPEQKLITLETIQINP